MTSSYKHPTRGGWSIDYGGVVEVEGRFVPKELRDLAEELLFEADRLERIRLNAGHLMAVQQGSVPRDITD